MAKRDIRCNTWKKFLRPIMAVLFAVIMIGSQADKFPALGALQTFAAVDEDGRAAAGSLEKMTGGVAPVSVEWLGATLQAETDDELTAEGSTAIEALTSADDAIALIRQDILNRDSEIAFTLTGDALAGITTENFNEKSKELGNALFQGALAHVEAGVEGCNGAAGDYAAKTYGGCTISIAYSSTGNKITSLSYTYRDVKYYTTKAQENQVDSKLQDVYASLNLSDPSLSELQKVYKIYDWIANNVSYDYENLNNTSVKTKYAAYGALIDGKAVCQGFANLFYRMCLDNGIDCRIVTGKANGGDHAWNIVKVGESYYYADVTWDCKVIEDTANGRQAKPGTLFYFLRNTLADHKNDTEWDALMSSRYSGLMAVESLYGISVKIPDGCTANTLQASSVTLQDICGNDFSDAQNKWYQVSVTDGGNVCTKQITVSPAATGLQDLVLAKQKVSFHDYTDGKCTVCQCYQDDMGCNLAGYTLSLTGNIGVNFYMELSAAIIADQDAYMEFTLPDNIGKKKVYVTGTHEDGATATTCVKNETTYYIFPCEVSSFEMTQAIKAQMFDRNGNSGTQYSYTVRDYAQYIIAHGTESGYTEGDVAFAKALLNYGAYAQQYFQVTMDDLANRNLNEAEQNVSDVTAESLLAYKVAVAKHERLGKFAGYSLKLQSETTLQVYFKPAEEIDDKKLIFTAAGQNVTPVRSGEYYVLTVDNIKAWELDKPYSFTVSDGENNLHFSCSALAYAYSVLNHSDVYDSHLVQLIRALRVYQQKAETYASGS